MKPTYAMILTALFGLIAIGCGGGGSESNLIIEEVPEAPRTIVGTVATGTPALATVDLIDKNGLRRSTVTDASGSYRFDSDRLHQPIMVRATLLQNGDHMYSYINDNNGTLNITPVTTLVVDHAAQTAGLNGGVSQLYTTFCVNSESILDTLNGAKTAVNAQMISQMQTHQVEGFDHFFEPFDANHTGYDAVLDDIDIEIYQDDVVLRGDHTTLDTLDYNFTEGSVSLTGFITDLSSDAPIANADITLTDRLGNNYGGVSDINGSFDIDAVKVRGLTMTVSAPGYDSVSIPRVATFLTANTNLGNIPMLPDTDNSNTQVSGLIFDSRTDSTPVANATLTYRRGYDNRAGSIVRTVTAGADGMYSTSISAGTYTVEVSGDGYETRYVLTHLYGTETQNIDLLTATEVTEGCHNDYFAVIRLNWGEHPRDIDSHLTGPLNESRFHIAFYNKVASTNGTLPADTVHPCDTEGVIASLDRDDVDSYGPETTTLCQVENGGEYKFYVHHYAGTGIMANSPASVTVITYSGNTNTFTAPATGSVGENGTEGDPTDNDIWYVFSLDSDGNINPVNQIIGTGSTYSDLIASTQINPSMLHNTVMLQELELFEYMPPK